MKEERDVRISRKHTLRQGFKWLIHIKTHTYVLAVTQRTHIGNPREKSAGIKCIFTSFIPF